MDLSQLRELGAVLPRTLFAKTLAIRRPVLKPKVEWSDPEVPEETGEIVDDTLDCWVRKRSSAVFLELAVASGRERTDLTVLRCVCHKDGTEVFESLAQVQALKEWLYFPLLQAVNEVNQSGPKASPPRTSSGASSRSPSAGAASRSGKRPSRKKSGRSG